MHADPRPTVLHLVSDAEFDEEMELLAESAGSAGLTVLELRIPRIDSDLSGLLLAFVQRT